MDEISTNKGNACDNVQARSIVVGFRRVRQAVHEDLQQSHWYDVLQWGYFTSLIIRVGENIFEGTQGLLLLIFSQFLT